MPRTRSSRPNSVSTTASLMQDVPGAFPANTNTDDTAEEEIQLSLSQAVAARRAEFVRPKHVRIKIGTWNVAGFRGAEKDVRGWFVEGKGVSEAIAGLSGNEEHTEGRYVPNQASMHQREDPFSQESRFTTDKPSIRRDDPGSLPGNKDVGLYVLGLQEMVDISSVTEAMRPYNDPTVANKWKQTVTEALPSGYQLVAEQQLIGLYLLIFASPEVAKEVRSVSTTSVGTGLGGFMGNKGAVTARIVLGETTRLVFVNCHLAAGADKPSLERRNWDAAQIVTRTRFEPIQDAMDLHQTTGEQLGDEDFAFWVGDLNYRLEGIPGDDVRRLLMLHTRNEYDLSQQSAPNAGKEPQVDTESIDHRNENRMSTSSYGSYDRTASPRSSVDTRASTVSTVPTIIEDEIDANEDPASLQTTLSSLLPHDELQQQMKTRKAFYDGWREGPISFLPTYKYDRGSVGVFDSSEKKRAPSWCDRILYRTRRDRLAYESKVREEENARKKDAEMKANGLDMAGNDDEILYDYDPETDGADPYDEYDEHENVGDNVVMTKEGFEDEISLEYYTAHQRVLSSDHKPLNAIFMLKYDAVVPELKAKVHAEVARELDKAENESRPNLTVIVDKHGASDRDKSDADLGNFEGVWFGDIRWAQAKHRTLTVANTGRVPASFSFIQRPVAINQKPGIAPSWLNLKIQDTPVVSSSENTVTIALEPGDTALVEVELRVFDVRLVSELNQGLQTLDDILVLRVEHGRDHFIPVRAQWLDTTLGHSIDKLTRIPEGGIRRLQGQKPDSGSTKSTSSSYSSKAPSSSLDAQPVRFSAPRELFRLTEAIEGLSARVVAEWEMMHHHPVATLDAATKDSTSPSPEDEPEAAPWKLHPAWPFDTTCWPSNDDPTWLDALSEACNALDCDTSLDGALAAFPFQESGETAPSSHLIKLYVLSSLLIIFLTSLSDGIIPPSLWTEIDGRISDNEKQRQKPINLDDEKSAIQEILSQQPSSNICFILITSMLDQILQETAPSTMPSTPTFPLTRSSTDDGETRLSPTRKAAGTLRRVAALRTAKLPSSASFSTSQENSKESTPRTALAKVFAEKIVRFPEGLGDKAKTVQERRAAEVVEMFLRRT
ncbi:Hypothetical protein R9X50_00360600 [Acrodontium crateriforme]|uniref:Inositol polyphosphate-related phosphatase domain-containing protein n=1 Tax=Acrodontium crateriforme TaxID=150365 RepID=A0AAQ3M6H6_9PEZI|nr:Hypothetical protein R9X50_00360600 [Acrodontium crateriforme]